MSTQTQAGRLEALKRALEAAREVEHEVPAMLDAERRSQHDQYMEGMKAGLQLAINAIGWELLTIAAGEAAAAAHAQPQ